MTQPARRRLTQMTQHRIRNWFADRVQRSPRLHACLAGAGSIMVFYPSPPPRFYRDESAALAANKRAVGDAMWAALHRAEQELGAPNIALVPGQLLLPACVADHERSAGPAARHGNPAAFTTQRG
jgi:hypothetical protein